MGELAPVIPAAGYSVNNCLNMATDVMADLISQRFNHKWNRMKVRPWYTSSWQQDYAQLAGWFPAPRGWLGTADWGDINNTALPKPTYYIEVDRDLPTTSISGNPPAKIDWLYNRLLAQGTWPGPAKPYTQPLGAVITPTNPATNILDANGNILVLTAYGVTGATAPVLPVDAAEGTNVTDGTCAWTVADPDSQGFRIMPLPPQQGVVYQVNVIAQMRTPPPFTRMNQLINPIPDDYANYFRDGFAAYCYKLSPNPAMRMQFPNQRMGWLAGIEASMKQGDREQTNAGFVPDRSVVAPQGGIDIGPANPYLYNVWPGR
jgi:hypothetical protein